MSNTQERPAHAGQVERRVMYPLPKLARVGDRVICRCKLPVPYNIIGRLDTPEAAAEVNSDLMSDSPMWELLDT